MDEREMKDFRDYERMLTEKSYNKILQCGLKTNTSIKLYNAVTVDEHDVATIGEWGGYWIQVAPQLFNNRIVMTPFSSPSTYDYGWCYPKGPHAILAVVAWDPQTQGEPDGFKKRIGTHKRMPGEMAATEEENKALMNAFLLEIGMVTEARPNG